MKLDDLTTSETDVRAVILYTKAIDDPGRRKAILEDATKWNVQTIFMQALRTAAGGAEGVGRKAEPLARTFIVNDDDVNVRSAPDEIKGQVIDRMERGARVQVTERTALTYTIDGNTSAWFHIREPDGWIFGLFLDEAPGIWAIASGVPTDQRIIAALARIDALLLADYGFSAADWLDPVAAWLPSMDGCFPASDLNGAWTAMEKALNSRDVASAMREAENAAAAAAAWGLPRAPLTSRG